jgi:hypothetical protein
VYRKFVNPYPVQAAKNYWSSGLCPSSLMLLGIKGDEGNPKI